MRHSAQCAVVAVALGGSLVGSSPSASPDAALKGWTPSAHAALKGGTPPAHAALKGWTLRTCSLKRYNQFDPQAFLRTYAGFTSQDLARVAAGTAVARSLTAEPDEVAVAGAVFMAVPRQTWVERFRDIESFKRNPAVLAIGRFASPPSASDMRSLSLEEDDVDALRKCRPGDCGMRMDQAAMARIQSVGLQGAGAEERATNAVREVLSGYAADYLRRGDAALMEYNDRQRPRRIAAELGMIVKRSPYFEAELSGMRGDVAGFAGIAGSANEHLVYWSVEKIASTPTISLTHAIIAAPTSGVTGIATRQIYGSHFFHASLGLTILADTAGPTAPGVTVIYINRTRVDAFTGLLGPVKRAAVRSRARSGTERLLRDLRTRLERGK